MWKTFLCFKIHINILYRGFLNLLFFYITGFLQIFKKLLFSKMSKVCQKAFRYAQSTGRLQPVSDKRPKRTFKPCLKVVKSGTLLTAAIAPCAKPKGLRVSPLKILTKGSAFGNRKHLKRLDLNFMVCLYPNKSVKKAARFLGQPEKLYRKKIIR